MCTYLTYLHGSHLTQNLGNFSPSLPHPRGLPREQTEAAGIQAEGSQGAAYFCSWLKNTSNFSKFRSLVARRAGPRGEQGPCFAAVGLQWSTSPFPLGCGWEHRPLQRGWNRAEARIKRNENEHSKIFLGFFFVLVFFFVLLFLG